ncbi:MAG: glycosyltransferase family 39 protein [Chloroflexi bacterium]|nr:glycosyltransferase family 39 protein [Chloroflexota bacterium]
MITPPMRPSGSARYLYLALLGALLLTISLFLLITWQRLDAPYQLDYGEGPLLDRALSLRAGQSLRDIYAVPDNYPYHIVNYPPLYFMLVAPFIDAANPLYTPGRIISLVAILIVAANIFLIVRQLTGNRYAAAVSALLLLASPVITFWTPYFRVDFLGLAFSTTGLTILLYWHHSWLGLILSVALIVAGAYTRQTYIVCAPLAGCVYLLSHSPRRAALFVALIGGLGLAVLLMLNAVTAGGFWFHVGEVYLAGGTPVSWFVLLDDKWRRPLQAAGPLFTILLLIFFWRYASQRFIAAYTLGSFISLIAMIKAGSNWNYVIELVVAFSLITGFFVDQAMLGAFKRWQHNLLFGLLILQVLVAAIILRTSFWTPGEMQARRIAEWHALRQAIVEADGKVLTDIEMGLLPQTGHPILFEPFDFSQMARKGLWDQSQVVGDIERQRFGLIVIQRASEYIIHERWTDEMRQALSTHYVESGSSLWAHVYRPRAAATAQQP